MVVFKGVKVHVSIIAYNGCCYKDVGTYFYNSIQWLGRDSFFNTTKRSDQKVYPLGSLDVVKNEPRKKLS